MKCVPFSPSMKLLSVERRNGFSNKTNKKLLFLNDNVFIFYFFLGFKFFSFFRFFLSIFVMQQEIKITMLHDR